MTEEKTVETTTGEVKEAAPAAETPVAEAAPAGEQSSVAASASAEEPSSISAPVNPLERSAAFTVSADEVSRDTESRLKGYARKCRIDGFRRGHVPMNIVRGMYGAKAYEEAMNEAVNGAVSKTMAAQTEHVCEILKVEHDGEENGEIKFKVIYEVMPVVTVPDIAALDFKRFKCEVTDKEVNETIDVMRRQRTTYSPVERASQKDDRVTVDFDGKLDGVAFEGGSAKDYSFIVGSGQMLPEFDEAATGMKPGETRAFKLTFPSNYGGKGELAGKESDFTITMKIVSEPNVPEVNDEFCKSLGVEGGAEALTAEVRSNLEREVKGRILVRIKDNVFNALINAVSFDVPRSLVSAEANRLNSEYVESMKQYGMKEKDIQPLQPGSVMPRAERNVKLGLLVAQIIADNKIGADEEEMRALATEMAAAYENPESVIEWYMKDEKSRRDVAAAATENKLVEFLLGKGKTTEEDVAFNALMGRA